MAIRVIDDTKLQNIAVAIQSKDNGGQMTVDEMPGRIEAIPSGGGAVTDPALVLLDWEGTKLAEYSREDALALTELPSPDTLPPYAAADHELLVFQSWNRSLANIKTWIQNHEDETCNVGAIYTTTDGVDHNFWNNPRLDAATAISMQKRGTASIGYKAFQSCYSLTQINIPDGVTSIGGNAFQYCYSLTQINIPDSVTSISANAFQYCYSLTLFNIPDSVTSIGSYAFGYCNSLTQINIPDGVTSIGSYAFQSCYSLTQINIPDGVTSIGSYAFQYCYSLTQINIPDGVTSIGANAFQYCYSLTQINIPDSVTSIGSYAFQSCYSLTQINIPDSVTSISANAFQYCNTLCDILNESKSTLSNTNAFDGLPSIYRIYVPRANLSWFETETNLSTIYAQGHIVAIEDHIQYLESIGFNVEAYKGAA